MELNDIDKEIQRLQELKKIKLAEAEQERLKSLANKPYELSVSLYTSNENKVALKLDRYCPAHVNMMRRVPSRKWNSNENWDEVDIRDYPAVVTAILASPLNVILSNPKSHDDICKELWRRDNIPWVSIKDGGNNGIELIFKDPYDHTKFPNTAPVTTKSYRGSRNYYIPKLAAHKLFADLLLHQTKRISWDPELKLELEKLAEDRAWLESITTQTDAPDYDIPLNGHHLLPFQRVTAKYIIEGMKRQPQLNGILNATEMGLGKTPTAIAVVEHTKARALVIVPAALRENWTRAIRKFTGEDPHNYFKSTPADYDFEDMILKKHRWQIITYDSLSRPVEGVLDTEGGFKREVTINMWVDLINSSGFDYIIMDEVHKAKNTKSARTQAVLGLKFGPKTKCLPLSGTPILNRPKEFFPVLSLVDPTNFNVQAEYERRFTDGRNGARNVTELKELLKPIMVRKEKKEVFPELPPVIPSNHFLTFTDKQRAAYDHLVDGLIADIESGDIIGQFQMSVLTKLLRLKQFCSAISADATADLATSLHDEATGDKKKVIIFSQFIPQVLRIHKLLGHEAVFITGEHHSAQERQLIVDKFQRDPDVKFIVCSTKAASEGLDMTQAGYVIFNDLLWTPLDHDQAIARAYGRIVDMHGVDVRFTIIPNTIMDWISQILMEKAYTFDQVVKGVNVDRVNESSIVREVIAMLRANRGKKL